MIIDNGFGSDEIEVIGNIHDDDLLEVQNG